MKPTSITSQLYRMRSSNAPQSQQLAGTQYRLATAHVQPERRERRAAVDRAVDGGAHRRPSGRHATISTHSRDAT